MRQIHNMKCAWLETLRAGKSGKRAVRPWSNVAAGQRYAMAIAKIFNADLVHDSESWKNFIKNDYDVIFVGYSTRYQEYKADVQFIEKNPNALIVHISTEYENAAPASLYYANRPFLHIANYVDIPKQQMTGAWKLRDEFKHVNVNALLYYDSNSKQQKNRSCIYWGRYRPDRAKYLKIFADAGVDISTSPKNIKKWIDAGVTAKTWLNKVLWIPSRESICEYMYSVYAEDVYTHTNYNCPANRWYESLCCDVQPLIHISCKGTFEKSGYVIHDDMWFDTSECLRVKRQGTKLRNHLSKWRIETKRCCAEERTSVARQIKDMVATCLSPPRHV